MTEDPHHFLNQMIQPFRASAFRGFLAATALALLFCQIVLEGADASSVLVECLRNSRKGDGCYRSQNDFNYRKSRVCFRMNGGVQERLVQDVTEMRSYLTLRTGRWILDDQSRVALHLNYTDPFDLSFQESATLIGVAGVDVKEATLGEDIAGADLHIVMRLNAEAVAKLKEIKAPELRKARLSSKEIDEWISKEVAVERHFFINKESRLLIAIRSFNHKGQALASELFTSYETLPSDSGLLFVVPKSYAVTVITSPEDYRVWTQKQLFKKKDEFFKNFEKVITNSPARSK